MNSIALTLIYPSILGKIKPYQNLSIICSGITLLAVFILTWFNNKFSSDLSGYLLVLSILFIITSTCLSVPFLFRKSKIATITDSVLYIEIDNKEVEFETKEIRFLLNLDNKKSATTDKIGKTKWGNYIIIPSGNSLKDLHLQFAFDEDILLMQPQLKIETYRSFLMSDTNDLLKNFMLMLWGAS